MKPESTPQLLSLLKRRSLLVESIRGFFNARGYLSIDTPIRIQAPAPEDYIDAEPSGNWYLRASPELHMKRLLGAGLERIYQIGSCFRKGELGPRHLPEFCMLEWYRTQTDCFGILEETIDLVRHCAGNVLGASNLIYRDHRINLNRDWEMLTVDEAFDRYAQTSLSVDQLLADNLFEITLVRDVQPHLGYGRPTVLRNFPAGMSSLAGRCADNPGRVERWELFIHGLELANAYTELTDYEDQMKRFEASRRLRQASGRDIYPLDHEYLDLLKRNSLPPCGGIAVGVDRFLMLLCDQPDIQNVVPFACDKPGV